MCCNGTRWTKVSRVASAVASPYFPSGKFGAIPLPGKLGDVPHLENWGMPPGKMGDVTPEKFRRA